MQSEKKKYNYMEPVLQKIHKDYITLPNKDVKRNKGIVSQVLLKVIKAMKKVDRLFEKSFTEIFYGGSFYDDLKVGKPEEFDLDFSLTLPLNTKPLLEVGNIPGFVQLKLNDFENFKTTAEAQSWSELAKLVDNKNYLITTKVSEWMESVIMQALNQFPKCPEDPTYTIFTTKTHKLKGKVHKAGPAFTLKLEMCGTIRNKTVNINLDLVPCFKFGGDQWPTSPFRSSPTSNRTFFIVPKQPHRQGDVSRYWRLSFQLQERDFIKDRWLLKPTIRLLKKLQENMDKDIVASYYIKTMFLWETEMNGNELWKNSWSYVFVTMLKRYKEYIEKEEIPYFWNKRNNLLMDKAEIPLKNLANRLGHIINAIESHPNDPLIVAEYLLNAEELSSFKANYTSKPIKSKSEKQKKKKNKPKSKKKLNMIPNSSLYTPITYIQSSLLRN